MLAVYRLLSSVAFRLPLGPRVLREAVTGRRAAGPRWRAWAEAARGAGPLVWAHGASVGEQQVLEPVLRRLAAARPDLQFVVSHTSPSVLPTGLPGAVCHRDYLPADDPRNVAAVLDAVRPALLLFGRGDLWPGLVHAAAVRGVPVGVVGGLVRPASLRLRWPARGTLTPIHRQVAWLGAATEDDAVRWRQLGVPASRIAVTGDPRHDRILERRADLAPATAIRQWAGDAPVLIAASLEPSDDAVVATALARLTRHASTPRAVVVPHDATPPRLAGLRRHLSKAGLGWNPWTRGSARPPDPAVPVVTVGSRGLLGDLYLGADLAYVGGGFRHGGLHAVAEPAAVGLPVLVGPRWHGAADAGVMVAARGAVPVVDAEDLAAHAARLLDEPAARRAQGLAARSVLQPGAADRTTCAVLRFLRE